MKPTAQTQGQPAFRLSRRDFLAAIPAVAALAGCMAPNYDVFNPRSPRGAEAVATLTEDIHRSFLQKVRRSPDYRVEISGRDGAIGPYSYRLVRREGEDRFYRFAPSLPSGERERSPEVQLGPGSQSFRLPIEPTGNFACDVLVNTRGNFVSFSFTNPEGSWEEISTTLKDSPSLRYEALYSPREGRLLVLASPTDLEGGMPNFISTASLDLRSGGLELRDYLRQAK